MKEIYQIITPYKTFKDTNIVGYVDTQEDAIQTIGRLLREAEYLCRSRQSFVNGDITKKEIIANVPLSYQIYGDYLFLTEYVHFATTFVYQKIKQLSL